MTLPQTTATMHLSATPLLVGLLLLESASPIVMRHDVDRARYLELARESGGSFAAVGGGCGTFIRRAWILTAAHVARTVRVGRHVTVNGIDYAIKRRVIHPEFEIDRAVLNDIALLELDRAVPDIEPARLYGESDEVGKQIVFLGTGWAGTGDTGMVDGAIDKAPRLRAAQNRADGSKPGYLRFTFDAPDSPGALPLEGISGPGDSGGPALLFEDGQAYIVGVSSHQDRRGARTEGLYGAYEYYTRVSEFRAWILATIGDT